ncbi:hypothetical protein H1C71_007869 [Ictidomys tridecemlineatus]|nr:hypothetical protein H1C71_007869 [Ictidomys tridecemlineatus]
MVSFQSWGLSKEGWHVVECLWRQGLGYSKVRRLALIKMYSWSWPLSPGRSKAQRSICLGLMLKNCALATSGLTVFLCFSGVALGSCHWCWDEHTATSYSYQLHEHPHTFYPGVMGGQDWGYKSTSSQQMMSSSATLYKRQALPVLTWSILGLLYSSWAFLLDVQFVKFSVVLNVQLILTLWCLSQGVLASAGHIHKNLSSPRSGCFNIPLPKSAVADRPKGDLSLVTIPQGGLISHLLPGPCRLRSWTILIKKYLR